MSTSRVVSRNPTSAASSVSPTTRSSIISSASAQRKQHKNDFSKFYIDLCHLNHSHPLQAVKQHLDKGVLDFVGDRIKFDEWYPIVSALRSDQNLHRVAIRLRHRIRVPIMDADTELKARNITKQPAITTKFVLFWLLESLRRCLSQSPSLTVLELEGLPIRGEFVAILAQGLLETRSLQHLSLNKCGIHDDGADIICMAVRNAPTIIGLDLSHCDLTDLGATSLAKLISHQKLNRYSETWKQTLRYRDPDVEAMAGLRRLTLNNNPDLGDRSIQLLVEEVRDDLWLRALDLQNTGLTDEGGLLLAQLVRNNPNLSVVDARGNPAMSNETLAEIMSVLAINNADKNVSEYKWINSNLSTNSSIADTKSISSRVPRPWGSATTFRRNNHRGTLAPTATYSRSRSSLTQKELPSWRVQDQIHIQENKALRKQVRELNEIINHEVKQKTEIVRENQQLKEVLDKCLLENKKLKAEFSKKTVISEETLAILEEQLSKLAAVFSNDDDVSETGEEAIPELISNIKAVFNKQPNGLKPILQPLEKNDMINGRNWNSVKEQVIWEEEEPPTSADSTKKTSEPVVQKEKAHEIFAKLLKNNEARNSHRRKKQQECGTFSEEEASLSNHLVGT